MRCLHTGISSGQKKPTYLPVACSFVSLFFLPLETSLTIRDIFQRSLCPFKPSSVTHPKLALFSSPAEPVLYPSVKMVSFLLHHRVHPHCSICLAATMPVYHKDGTEGQIGQHVKGMHEDWSAMPSVKVHKLRTNDASLCRLCEEEIESAWLWARKVGTVEMSTRGC